MVKNDYTTLGKKFNTSFLSEHSLLKIHRSEEALEEWHNIKNKASVEGFLNNGFSAQHLSRFIDYRFGYLLIEPVWRVNSHKLISFYADGLRNENKLMTQRFHHADLEIHADCFKWQSQRFKHIVFCEGIEALQNPFFKQIAFKPAKGECMIIKIPNFETDLIIQKDLILIPLGNQRYWAGATNTWNDLHSVPTVAGIKELNAGLTSLLKLPYEILEYKAAIRPTIKDRVPVVGQHPEIKNMFVLNGMGTKGASLSNYYAKQLYDHIFNGTPVNKEANINRFY